MRYQLYIAIAFLLLLVNCSAPKQKESAKAIEQASQDSSKNIALQKANTLNWKDTIVKHYIETTQNPLVSFIKNDTTHGWSYIFDNDTRDGKNFITVRIGQSFEDHFATSAWLYIDSLTRRTYELDIANDSLIALGNKLNVVNCDTTVINGRRFIACQGAEINLFVLNNKNDTIYKHQDWTNGFEFIDFNEDGFKDILFHYITNVPDIYDLALFDKESNTFKIVENFGNYPAPVKIKGVSYYYSYHRSGCADSNWGSDLFYIDNYKTFRLGTISGIGCEDEKKTGIFISKIAGEKEILVKEILKKPGNYENKWDFISEYWMKNYKSFLK